jgi:hypothetical protein
MPTNINDPLDPARVDWTLGERPPRMGVSTAPWAEPVIDFTPKKLDVVGPTTTAARTLKTHWTDRAYYADGTNHAPRQKMVQGQFANDAYMSYGDKSFVRAHGGINRIDTYPGTEAESDAVFSGGGIEPANFQRQDPSYTGDLSELIDEVADVVRAGGYGLLTEEHNGGDFDELLGEMAAFILSLTEQFAVSPEDVLQAIHICVCEGGDVLPSEFLEKMNDTTREQRLQYIVDMLHEFSSEVREALSANANKVSHGLSGEKPKKPKATSGITNAQAARAVAVAASGIGGKKKQQANTAGSKGIVGGLSEATIARVNQILRG